MLAHAISRTTTVTASSSVRGTDITACRPLCPRAPSATVTCFERKRDITRSLTPTWSGASTSLRSRVYGALIAVRACSIVTPGFSRAKAYTQYRRRFSSEPAHDGEPGWRRSYRVMGRNTAGRMPRVVPVNRRGATPTIATGWSFTSSV